MGQLRDAEAVEALLAKEIVITQEVRDRGGVWGRQGALIFGLSDKPDEACLSDKPDEASLPTSEQALQGYQAIHRVRTHAVGER
jgi:hypothetical protein